MEKEEEEEEGEEVKEGELMGMDFFKRYQSCLKN